MDHYTATAALDRGQARALMAAADADTGAQALRAVVRLLLHNALRVDEACTADLASLGEDKGHQVLTVMGKGNRKVKIPLPPAPAGRWTPTSPTPRRSKQISPDRELAALLRSFTPPAN